MSFRRDSLQGSLATFAEFTETISVPVFVFDDRKILHANESALHLTGQSRSRISTIAFWELVHPAFRQSVEMTERRRLRGETAPDRYGFRLSGPTSSELWIDFSCSLIRLERGNVVAATAVDRTELNEAQKQAAIFGEAVQCSAECVCIIDKEDKILFVNDAFLDTYGYTSGDLIGRKSDFIHSSPGSPGSAGTESASRDGERWSGELLHRRKDGSEFLMTYSSAVVNDPSVGGFVRIFVGKDVSQTKQAEEAVRESEDRYRVILQSISDEVIIVDERGIIETINDAVLSRAYLPLHGPVVGMPLTALFPSGFADRRLTGIKQAIGRKKSLHMEERLPLPQQEIWLSTKINPLIGADGSCSKAVVVSRDITIEKDREEFLRSFTRSVLSAQEEERTRIARELHDGLAQRLAVLRLDLRTIETSLQADQEQVRAQARTALSSVSSLIEETRRIAQDLVPAILEDIGLTAAIEKLVREFSEQHDVSTQWDLIDLDGHFQAKEEIHIYRIIQEVVHNISRHAKATNVSLTIRRNSHTVEFVLKDNGIGFKASPALPVSTSDVSHRGLRGLQERAGLLNGRLAIVSAPGEGTTMTLSVPVTSDQSLPFKSK